MSDNRIDKHNYYLNIAATASERSTCLKRKYGAVIVKNDEIISTGYNGAPRGRRNCNEIGTCLRIEKNIPSGQRYEICRSVHAEMNAIISASRDKMIGSTLYLSGYENDNSITKNAEPCSICKRLIINAGIEKVIVRCSEKRYKIIYVQEFIDHDDSIEDDKYGYGLNYIKVSE